MRGIDIDDLSLSPGDKLPTTWQNLREWWRGLKLLVVFPSMVREVVAYTGTRAEVRNLESKVKEAEDRADSAEGEYRLLKKKVKKYTKEVKENSRLQSETLSRLNESISTVFSNTKQFEDAEKKLLSVSAEEVMAKSELHRAYQTLEVMEKELMTRPAIGTNGVRAKNEALVKINAEKQNLRSRMGADESQGYTGGVSGEGSEATTQ